MKKSGEKRFIYGKGPVRELLRERPEKVHTLWVADPHELGEEAAKKNVSVTLVAKKDLDAKVGADVLHQGVVAEVGAFVYRELSELVPSDHPALIVMLDGITDPHNLGAILRSAYLFGADGVVLPKDRSAEVSAIATKTSAGASELISVARVANLKRAAGELKDAGLWFAALAAGGDAKPLWDLDASSPLGLVCGSEGKGIRRLLLDTCDFRIEIPMVGRGVGSLNVSVAAGLALYEVSRQRRSRG